MFDKKWELIPYKRETYTFAESLYEEYIKMRQSALLFERIKYPDKDDNIINSKEAKEAFIAGVYTMLSLIGDM